MPILPNSTYRPPFLFRNPHLNTVYPALFRRVEGVNYQRQRLSTPDHDFIDLDWSQTGNKRLLLALHGLEGDSSRPYIRGIIRRFNRAGWDGVAMNFRGCSGEPNLQPWSYHMGVTPDLEWVIGRIIDTGQYDRIVLTGFSLGGNVVLRYLGERAGNTPGQIAAAIAFSVPVHIRSANLKISKWFNSGYLNRFMRSLNHKMDLKTQQFPGLLPELIKKPADFQTFDNLFTAPLHGFKNAEDYWEKCSSLPVLEHIRTPTLLVNALDDTFLSKACYPFVQADKNPCLYLETPRWGGHTGFVSRFPEGAYWSEERALEFAESR